ncbi:gas vesicle protein GvpG [Sphaerisporangium sp. TRM90804]|uniref:gas vesicle protein GvpG n=1 Tax=Sphaerisporangium sp. TRM90804 TaxID=3031113 RepID=UPI00244D436F|nr:gas vesicle protein GvpG [Sphaerisporangium sp. TRM90804]MDH2430160.1 gas vesicle protein GvpG [Sphaerisporangium sp. TRM90804]
MGLFTALVGWPLAPVRLLIKVGELIEQQVDAQLHDPAMVRRRLEEVEEARAAGLISEEEEARAVEDILGQMIT